MSERESLLAAWCCLSRIDLPHATAAAAVRRRVCFVLDVAPRVAPARKAILLIACVLSIRRYGSR